MRSNASSVSTSPSVARIAASESAFAASVPPIPPTSTSSSSIATGEARGHLLREAVRGSGDAAGDRLADGDDVGLEAVRLRCSRRARSRSCASRRSRAACRAAASARAAHRGSPGSGWTMPMLVSAGSVSTSATSPRRELPLEAVDVIELDDARSSPPDRPAGRGCRSARARRRRRRASRSVSSTVPW